MQRLFLIHYGCGETFSVYRTQYGVAVYRNGALLRTMPDEESARVIIARIASTFDLVE